MLLVASMVATGRADSAIDFLRKNCVDCHGPDTQEGGFRADTLSLPSGSRDDDLRWTRVIVRLQAGEMPPPEVDQPSDDEVAQVLHQVKQSLAQEQRRRRKTGRVAVRRLNRLEYENTIHDLLGIDIPLLDLLPEDEVSNGFSNQADALSVSLVHIQQYMAAAERALRACLVREPQEETEVYRFSYDNELEKRFYEHPNNRQFIRLRDGNLRFYEDTHIEVPAFLRQFAAITRNKPGTYRIRVTASTEDFDGKSLAFSLWTAAVYKRKKLIGYFDAPSGSPATIEITRRFGSRESIIVAPYRINKARVDSGFPFYAPQRDLPKGWKKEDKFYEPEGPSLVIAPIEIEGPLYSQWPPESYRRLFGDIPMVPHDQLPKGTLKSLEVSQARYMREKKPHAGLTCDFPSDPIATSEELLTKFAARAFRRPVTQEDIQPALDIVKARLEGGECYEDALIAGYQVILCSPDFLFLVEEPGLLSDHALACRLSYFLWRSMPDDDLRRLADRGELSNPDVLRRETERLLRSPRSQAFVHDFLDHWLRLREIDATTPDKELFPEYFQAYYSGTIDGLLHESVVKETQLFFADMLEHDRSVMEIIDSDETFLNNRLAEHYGIDGVDGVQMRRVRLPEDSPRGGILTQASVLKVTANGANTSPVIRGNWLLENILGSPVPPPPPDAGSIEPDTRGATNIREQLAKHQANASCAGCHRKIDPPGFALEAFDPIGRYREAYRVTETGEKVSARHFSGAAYIPVKYLLGAPVDPSAEMADGTTFRSPQEFKQILMQQEDAVTRSLATKLTTFATGSPVEPGDLLELDEIVASVGKKNRGLRTLVHEIIQSDLFRTK